MLRSPVEILQVSESLVEMNSSLQFYDGITTQEIQKILVKSASDLISLESPNYQFLDYYYLQFRNKYSIQSRKMTPPLRDIVERNVEKACIQKIYLMIIQKKNMKN